MNMPLLSQVKSGHMLIQTLKEDATCSTQQEKWLNQVIWMICKDEWNTYADVIALNLSYPAVSQIFT